MFERLFKKWRDARDYQKKYRAFQAELNNIYDFHEFLGVAKKVGMPVVLTVRAGELSQSVVLQNHDEGISRYLFNYSALHYLRTVSSWEQRDALQRAKDIGGDALKLSDEINAEIERLTVVK